MCGGNSLHKKDWLNIGLGLGAVGLGAGAAGVGPLSGLLGTAAGAAAPGEAAGAFTGTISQLPGMGTTALKGLDTLQKAQALMKLADPSQQPIAPMSHPQQSMPDPKEDLNALLRRMDPFLMSRGY